MAARRQALQVAAGAVERRLNADPRDHLGPTVPCACGQAARYAGRRSKTFTSVLGALTLERAYYHCAACARGVFPRDRTLGLAETSLSPAVTRMVGLAAAMVSFAESGELLRDLAGVPVNPKQVGARGPVGPDAVPGLGRHRRALTRCGAGGASG